MYQKTPPTGKYKVFKIGDKVFYEKKSHTIQKNKYSNRFKRNNSYDVYLKLKIIESHKKVDFEKKIDKWKKCIDNCIYILHNEYGYSVSGILDVFELKKYGFSENDYE